MWTSPGLADFVGAWRLSRWIDDRKVGATGRLTGQAVFRWAGEGLVYEETGALSYGGAAPVTTRQSHLWEGAAGRIVIRFEDGRPFHEFPLGEAAPEADHHCTPDLYRVRYGFGDWPCWSARWEVIGPRKDYTLMSRYEPDAA